MTLHFRANEQTRQTNHTAELTHSRCHRPTNPLITGAQRKGGRTKAQSTQPAVLAPNQIAELRANQGRIPTRMLLDHEIIPQSVLRILMATEQIQMQPFNRIDRSGNPTQPRQALSRGAQSVVPFLALRLAGGKQQPAFLQLAHCDSRTGKRRTSVGRKPIQRSTDHARQRAPALMRFVFEHLIEVSN